MKIKTSELTGRALDWAVALADGFDINSLIGMPQLTPEYSTDWSECGPLIEKYNIELVNELLDCVLFWSANCNYVSDDYLDGQTPQIAICRAVVAAQLGSQVNIPDDLLEKNQS
ncbi:phage protein NinX family protein [Xenorhabdus bovienii]|uniref:phage protein NinX family protein n=1 Tax=Xenorhabdus bovienii TaxID=40576 RepID=UPI003DA4C11A